MSEQEIVVAPTNPLDSWSPEDKLWLEKLDSRFVPHATKWGRVCFSAVMSAGIMGHALQRCAQKGLNPGERHQAMMAMMEHVNRLLQEYIRLSGITEAQFVECKAAVEATGSGALSVPQGGGRIILPH